MNTWRRSMGAALLVWAVALSLATSPRATAQGGNTSPQCQAPGPTLRTAGTGAGKEPGAKGAAKESEARRVALERYQMVKRLERTLGFFPLWQSFDAGCVVLFPAGRADRVYLLLWGARFLSPRYADDTLLLCYQRKSKTDRLVYQVALVAGATQRRTRIKSLLDYLGSHVFLTTTSGSGREVNESYFVTGKVCRSARQDLASERNYVQYSYTPYTDTLEARSLSALQDGHPGEEERALYPLNKDPITHAKLGPGEFYRRYGLPMVKKERALLSNAPK